MTGKNQLSVLDREQLRNAALDDEEFMREVLTILIDDTARQIEPLQRAMEREDATECKRLAHYSKGACASVGAVSTAAILREIELQAARHDFSACRESLRSLSAELDKVRFEAARFQPLTVPPSTEPEFHPRTALPRA